MAKFNSSYFLTYELVPNITNNFAFLYKELLIGVYGVSYGNKQDFGEFVGAFVSRAFNETLDMYNPNPEDWHYELRVW
jgi:hypothetical protein